MDRRRRKEEKKSRQRELPCRDIKENSTNCEETIGNVEKQKPTAPPQTFTNLSDVSVSLLSPPPYHYSVVELEALKMDPDLNCSPPRRPSADPTAPAMKAAFKAHVDTAKSINTVKGETSLFKIIMSDYMRHSTNTAAYRSLIQEGRYQAHGSVICTAVS